MATEASETKEEPNAQVCQATEAGRTVADQSEQSTEEAKDGTIPRLRFALLCVGVLLGLFMSMLDSSIVATCLYVIGDDFKSLSDINWVALAYTLANLGCAVVFARISDIVGRRAAFMSGYVIFFSFSLACGFSQSLNQLIAFRALQGVGGSGLFSLTMIILPELSPPEMRQHIAAAIGMVIAIAGVLGPILGGVLTEYASWRWVFWINAPIGVVSITFFFLTWPKPEHLPNWERRTWREVDYAGSILTIAAAVLVVFAFQSAGSSAKGEWRKADFLAPLLTGLLCWSMLIAWQYVVIHRFANRLAPAFPLRLFKNRFYATAAVNTTFMGFAYFILIYSIPMRVQVVGGKSTLVAGLMLLPMIGGSSVGSISTGKINAVKNYIFETILAGSCLMTLGCGLLSTLSHELDRDKLLGFIVLCGLGFGLTVSACTMGVALEAPIRDFAPAQGIVSQIRMFGGSLGIAASTVILHNKALKYLTGVVSAGEQGMLGSDDVHLSSSQWEVVRYTYADAFKLDMKIAAGVSAIAVISTFGAFRHQHLLMSEQRQKLLNDETARRRLQQ